MKKIVIVSCLCFASAIVFSQSKQKSTTRFSVSGGVGWNHYINTLKIGSSNATEDHIGFSFRLLWEPEHRLSLGLESGYYTFYSLSKTASSNSPGSGESSFSVIPILLHLRMRVINNFYLTAGTGASILSSKTTVLKSTSESSQVSLADFQLSAIYLHPLTKKISLGGEIKFLNIAKTEDFALSLQGVISYKF
jgi:Outer membrane protein beta-barrel domain